MTRLIFIPLLVLITSCASLSRTDPVDPVSTQTAPLLLQLDAASLPPIAVVLSYMQRLCALERPSRLDLIRTDERQVGLTHRLRRLLLASCEVDFTPGIFADEYAVVTTQWSWPEPYQALLATLQRQLHAVKRTEAVHAARLQELQLKLDALSEIEESIRSQP